MSNDDRTWREKQQEHQRELAAVGEQTVSLRARLVASIQHIEEVETQIEAQKREHDFRLAHWLFNRQLKRLRKQRPDVEAMLDGIADLEQRQEKLKEEVEEPPPARFRRRRVVSIPAEAVFFLMLMSFLMWLIGQWLIRR